MTEMEKLLLIKKIIDKSYEYPGADATSWAGFMEGTLSAIYTIATFGESEDE